MGSNVRASSDRFTERARAVLILAQEEAQRYKQDNIGTEHLLLGLINDEDGVACRTLVRLGIERAKVRGAIEGVIVRGEREVVGEMSLTIASRQAIELARDESRELGHYYIGTEHLLLGLIRQGNGTAAKVLHSLGAELGSVRSQILAILAESGGVE
jgi:ATP-dependent Clp protease ATP-binding subunit ClpC